jgi:hypothetical protein
MNREQKKDLKKEHKSELSGLAFGRTNYIILIFGLLVIFAGFLLMMGGGSDDPNVFNPEIFSTRRITVAPVVVLAGFIIEVVAILYKPKA